jgi:hypothetical protein
MAAQKELVFKLKFVDENGAIVEKTANSINDINKSITDLKNELDNTELGSEAWNELAEDLGKAEDALDKTTEAINETKNAQKSLGAQLQGAPGIVGKVSQSVKGLGQTFKALLANPVVAVLAAIVGALTLLFKAFTSTKAGGEKMEQVMAGIGAALDVLRDRVLKVGGAIIKFFSGDFAGAAEDIKGAFSGIGDEIAAEFQEAMRIKAELQAITDAQRELNNERAVQNTLIAKAKLIINDETKSYKERQAALEEVRQAEIALAKQEEILAQRRYDAIKAQNALSDSSKEALDEEAAAFQRLQQAQLASLQKQKELYDQQKALRDRERAEQKAAYQKRQQELKALADLEEQLNLELIQDQEDRAEKELDIQEEKLKQQIRNLRISKDKENDLLLKAEKIYQEKREKLSQDTYDALVKQNRDYQDYIIAAEIYNAGVVVEQQQRITEDSINYINQKLDAAGLATEEAFGYNKQELEDRQQVLDHLEASEFSHKEMMMNSISRYYETQKYEAQVAYERDIADTERRNKEKQLQIEAAHKLLGDDQQALTARLTQINEYFDNYEENRAQQHAAQIGNINREQQAELTKVQEEFSLIRQKIAQQERDAQYQQQQLAIAGFDALAELAGRESELGKALAIASTTISTYQAAQAAYASQLTIPTPDAPVRAAVAAGIAVAQGLARVMAITNTNTEVNAADGLLVGQGSGRMDNMSVNVSNGESIINARSTRMFKPLLSAINQAGGGRRFAAGGITGLSTQTSPETNLLNQISQLQGNTPIKTYVVSSEVSSGVSLDRQIKSRSIL